MLIRLYREKGRCEYPIFIFLSKYNIKMETSTAVWICWSNWSKNQATNNQNKNFCPLVITKKKMTHSEAALQGTHQFWTKSPIKKFNWWYAGTVFWQRKEAPKYRCLSKFVPRRKSLITWRPRHKQIFGGSCRLK